MTSIASAELCRLTVFGPGGRADLAVPVSTPVSTLLPVFLRHTVDQADLDEDTGKPGSWVLQRLGGAPLDPDGTPETLDWLEGEQLYLRPAEDPLPELDFDDLADGIATVVANRTPRWRPEYSKYTFLSACGLLAVVVAMVLLGDGPTAVQAGAAAGVSGVFGGGALIAGRKLPGFGALSALFGLSCCGFAGLAGLIGADGAADETRLTPTGLLAGSAFTALAAVVMVAGRLSVAPGIAVPPLITVLLACAGVLIWLWLGAGFDLADAESAGVVASVFLAVVIFAPKIALRAARMRGPQLPRNADELQFDIEPASADDVQDKAIDADSYLSAGMVAAAVVFTGSYPFLMADDGWAGPVLVAVLACAALLRARTFLAAWQRIAMTVAGAAGLAITSVALAAQLSPQWRGILLFGLLGLLYPLVQAVLRPPMRRPLPIWGHLANIADTTMALAVVPVLLQLLGVYAWARGLGG